MVEVCDDVTETECEEQCVDIEVEVGSEVEKQVVARKMSCFLAHAQ